MSSFAGQCRAPGKFSGVPTGSVVGISCSVFLFDPLCAHCEIQGQKVFVLDNWVFSWLWKKSGEVNGSRILPCPEQALRGDVSFCFYTFFPSK